MLAALGLWDAFLQEGHERCPGSCSSWGNDAPGYNDFLLSPCGCGWRLDRSRFDAFLRRSAKASGVTFLAGARLRDCAFDDRGVQLSLAESDGSTEIISCAFVVDATGSRSVFARRAGARQLFLDRLAFVYGFFDISEGSSPSRMTLIEAEEDGWWYAARLPGDRMVAAFATDAGIIRNKQLSRAEMWFARASRTRHVGVQLQGCRFISDSLAVRVAPSFLLDPGAGSRWLAVGDAAASYDPLSSQGIQKALEDGIRGAEAITGALDSDMTAMSAFATASRARFEEYLANRNHFYSQETRWADAPFWKRRRARAHVQGSRHGEAQS